MPRAVKPEFVFYDSACLALREIIARKDQWFYDIAMPVDVFRHKSKHKVSDHFCQEFCNPAAYPQLMTEDDKWYFNSSAAEQANTWLGKYHPIVRDMLPDKFDFFLDEMIMHRNRLLVPKLQKRRLHPNHTPVC